MIALLIFVALFLFHVLYHTSTDALQHVTQAQISKIMSAVNTLYSNNNINLEFDLATTDPNGNALLEAGIDRQYISTDSLECDKFMNGDLIDNSKYVSMLWNLNKYINVFLYEFKTDNSGYVTMHAAGVIDPAKVNRVALENAASIAGMFLTTECVITEKKEDNPAPQMPMGGGMGGMM